VIALNLVNDDFLEVNVTGECTRTYKLNGVGDFDNFKSLARFECAFKNACNGLSVISCGDVDF
jgi:hypothetical protein